MNASLEELLHDSALVFNWTRLRPATSSVRSLPLAERICNAQELDAMLRPDAAIRAYMSSSTQPALENETLDRGDGARHTRVTLQFGFNVSEPCPLLAYYPPSDEPPSLEALSSLWYFTLGLDSCQSAQWAPADCLECLTGRSILFVGDSLTRYQFYSLLWLLFSAAWPYPFVHPSASGFISGLYGKEWAAMRLTEMLGGALRWVGSPPLLQYKHERLNITLAFQFDKGPTYANSTLYHLDRLGKLMHTLGRPPAPSGERNELTMHAQPAFDVLVENVGLWDLVPDRNASDVLFDATNTSLLLETVRPFYRDFAQAFPRTRLIHRQIADRNHRPYGMARHARAEQQLDAMEWGVYSQLAQQYNHTVLPIRRVTQQLANAGALVQHDSTHLLSYINTAVNQLLLQTICRAGFMYE